MDRHEMVEQLMAAFAERTGLIGSSAARRYLWTDAFAVCNYLELYRTRANHEFLDLEQVWLVPENRRFAARTDHQDINDVMLATSLAPGGSLGPAPDGDQT